LKRIFLDEAQSNNQIPKVTKDELKEQLEYNEGGMIEKEVEPPAKSVKRD
jgi:hypothetical protein